MVDQFGGRHDRSGTTAPGPYHTSVELELEEAVDSLRPRMRATPRWGIVLGSGLAGFSDQLEETVRVPFENIPHLKPPSVSGHPGELCFGRAAGVPVACLAGRIHLYEGHPVQRVVLGVRLLAKLGCNAVLLTNAAGGIRVGLAPGTFMLITDHINLTGKNPLEGFVDPFVDMSRAYDTEIADIARRAASDVGVELAEGTYAGVLGPSYETPAEIRMLAAAGADAVGMSTVLETIALRHAGVRVGGLSCITNWAAGVSALPLDHGEVREVAARVSPSMMALLRRLLELGAEIGKGVAP